MTLLPTGEEHLRLQERRLLRGRVRHPGAAGRRPTRRQADVHLHGGLCRRGGVREEEAERPAGLARPRRHRHLQDEEPRGIHQASSSTRTYL